MLDRIDADRAGMVDRLGAMGMGRHGQVQGVGSIDHGLDFGVGHQLGLWIVTHAGDAARGHDLDQVDAVAEMLAHFLHRLVRPVDNAILPAGLGQRRIKAVGRIAMAAGGAQDAA